MKDAFKKMYFRNALPNILILLFCAQTSCGLVDGEYKPYGGDKTQSTTQDTATEDDNSCSTEALKLFTDTILPAIKQTCANCHGAGGVARSTLAMSGDDSKSSATNLYAFTGGSSTKLIKKLSDGGNHGGGVLIGSSIQANSIEGWVDAQAKCQ